MRLKTLAWIWAAGIPMVIAATLAAVWLSSPLFRERVLEAALVPDVPPVNYIAAMKLRDYPSRAAAGALAAFLASREKTSRGQEKAAEQALLSLIMLSGENFGTGFEGTRWSYSWSPPSGEEDWSEAVAAVTQWAMLKLAGDSIMPGLGGMFSDLAANPDSQISVDESGRITITSPGDSVFINPEEANEDAESDDNSEETGRADGLVPLEDSDSRVPPELRALLDAAPTAPPGEEDSVAEEEPPSDYNYSPEPSRPSWEDEPEEDITPDDGAPIDYNHYGGFGGHGYQGGGGEEDY